MKPAITWKARLALAAALLSGCALPSARADTPARTLKICVAADAPAVVRQAAQSVLDAVHSDPLLQVMAGDAPPSALTDTTALEAAKPGARAYSHLVLVGLPTDPIIHEVWQREAKVEGGGFYIFGFGHLRGDIGYIESDRNPYLHGAAIKVAPFETETVVLTGSTPVGVALAVSAFLKNGLINGVVAAPGWRRASATVLDHDPLPPDFALPAWLPAQAGGATRIGVTQASEEEYRGVLADAGVEPQVIWRVKYFHAGDWDGAGAAQAFTDYMAGLHRRAYGSTLWCARFGSGSEAAQAAPKIAAAAKLARRGDRWTGSQPAYGFAAATAENPSPGPLTLWQQGAWLLLSTLPDADTEALRAPIAAGGGK